MGSWAGRELSIELESWSGVACSGKDELLVIASFNYRSCDRVATQPGREYDAREFLSSPKSSLFLKTAHAAVEYSKND